MMIMQGTAEELEKRNAEAAAAAPIPDLLHGDTHNLINVIMARTRALRQASLAARKMTSSMHQASPATVVDKHLVEVLKYSEAHLPALPVS